ncbi:MAG: DUF3999 family protein [Verrucomicrobiota bacterium]
MRKALILIGAVAATLVAHADENLFEFQRKLGPAEKEGVAAITLDAASFRELSPDFRDLRIMKQEGDLAIEWPYVIEEVSSESGKVPEKLLSSRTVSLNEGSDGSIEMVIRLSEGVRGAASLELDTPLRDFEKSIDVYGSADEENWEPLVEGSLIFDRERFMDLRRTRVELPENDLVAYRVRLEDATDEQRSSVRKVTEAISERGGESRQQTMEVKTRSFRIDALRLYSAPVEEAITRGEVSYPLTLVSSKLNEEDRNTEVEVEMGGVPLRELTVETEEVNFRRDVRLEVPADGDRWQTVERGVLYRYRIGEVNEENLTLRVAEKRGDRFRLVIENGDNPPIKVNHVSARGAVYEVRFLTNQGEEFTMLLGSDSIEEEAPRYDVAAIRRAVEAEVAMVPLLLGPIDSNPIFSPDGVSGASLFEQSWILWLLIGLVVVVLIAVLYGAAKRIEAISE